MRAMSQKVVYITVLMIVAIINFAFAQSGIVDDKSKIAVTSIAVAGDNIFAGTRTNGVYRSVDGGKVWAPVNKGLPVKAQVLEMAAGEKNVFTIVYSQYPRMYVSADNGMNWTEVSVSPTNREVKGVASFKNKIFAATTSGLYESTDDGAHWALVKGVNEKEMTSVIATRNCVLACYQKGHYTSIFYSSTDGTEWNMLKETNVRSDQLEVHGNNFIASFCQNNDIIGNHHTCGGYVLWILDKNAKKWERLDFKARYFGFGGDNIYAVTVEITESKKKGVGYKREVLMSDDRGRSWKKVDEKTDPFVTTDYDMQEKLSELKVLEPIEIEERVAMRKGQKLAAEKYAVEEAKRRKAYYEAGSYGGYQSSSSSSSGSKQPDYRALSNDRFNAMHNTNSYIDSKGGMHIR